MDRLRAWLEATTLPDDGRLPPERRLAEMVGMSRAELRKGLARLETDGLVWRHVGKGTFLVDRAARGRQPDTASLAQVTGPPEAMQVRMILEPEIAGLAARCASAAQIARLVSLCRQMRLARAWPDYQRLDAEFHASLATAAGNGLLAEIHAIVNEVRGIVVWGGLAKRSLSPPADYHSFDEHEAIVSAIADRDRSAAKAAMRRHLRSTSIELGLDK